MICPNCGKKIPFHAQFCPHCGTAQKEKPKADTPVPSENISTESTQQPTVRVSLTPQGKKVLLLVLVVVILLAVLLFALWPKSNPFVSTAPANAQPQQTGAQLQESDVLVPDPVSFFQLKEGQFDSDELNFYFYLSGDGGKLLKAYERLAMYGSYDLEYDFTTNSYEEYSFVIWLSSSNEEKPFFSLVLYTKYFPEIDVSYILISFVEGANPVTPFWIDPGSTCEEPLTALEYASTKELVDAIAPSDEEKDLLSVPQPSDETSSAEPSTTTPTEPVTQTESAAQAETSSESAQKASYPDTAFQSPLSYWNLTEDNLQENKIAEDGVFLQSVYIELDEPLRLVKNYLLDLCLSAPFQQSKMTEEDYIDQQGKYFVTYYLTYTGQEKLDSYTDWTGNSGQIVVYANIYYTENRALISWYWVDDLQPVDMELRAVDMPVPLKGSSSSSSGQSSSSSQSGATTGWFEELGGNPVPCPFCNDGKETCSACNGNKGKWVYDNSTPNYSGKNSWNNSAKTWEPCTKCGGTGEQDCTHCGGDGEL